ncbi:MAG: choice-of-anchor E domain-containing protein [Gloeotrichia echinulata CP02]|jgi:hypothetical protein|nr:choice-of-anchor E domain-containing protein [Gloeotrichia echinulata DEX184]
MASKLFTTLAAATTLAVIVTTAGAANAGTFTQSVEYKPKNPDTKILDGGYVATDINDTISFKKFDSTLGKLKSVTIDFSSDLKGNAQVTNKEANSTDVKVILSGLLKLQLPKNVERFEINPTEIYNYTLAGRETKELAGLTASIKRTKEFTEDEFLQYFIGKENPNFTFIANAQSGFLGGGNLKLATSIETYAKAGVTLTYNYDAKSVPEPSALLGVGLIAGFGLMSKTKKSWLKTSNSNV